MAVDLSPLFRGIGTPTPLWVASFPRLCYKPVRVKKVSKQAIRQYGCTHLGLLSPVDVA